MHLNHDTFHTKEKQNVSFGAKRLWMPGMVKHLALCLRIIDSLLVTCRVMIQLDWENKSFTSKSDLQSHQVEILLFIGVKVHMSWIYIVCEGFQVFNIHIFIYRSCFTYWTFFCYVWISTLKWSIYFVWIASVSDNDNAEVGLLSVNCSSEGSWQRFWISPNTQSFTLAAGCIKELFVTIFNFYGKSFPK